MANAHFPICPYCTEEIKNGEIRKQIIEESKNGFYFIDKSCPYCNKQFEVKGWMNAIFECPMYIAQKK